MSVWQVNPVRPKTDDEALHLQRLVSEYWKGRETVRSEK